MNKRLKLHIPRKPIAYFPDFRKGKLARQHDAGGAERMPCDSVRGADDACLRGDVERRLGQIFPHKMHNADIGGDDGVRRAGRHGGKRGQKLPQRRIFRLARHGVERKINSFAETMGKFHRTAKLLIRKIIRRGAHTEALAREINSVRAV